MIDRGMQALHLLALEPIAEVTGDRNSYGFRKGRSTHDAIGRCFQLLSKKASPQWILDCDVKSCFDEISHEWLLRHVPPLQVDQATMTGNVAHAIVNPVDWEGTLRGIYLGSTTVSVARAGLGE